MPDSTSPDLLASTGVNDPGTPWGVGLLQTALQGGITLGQAALQDQTPVKQNNGTPATPVVVGTATPAAPTSDSGKYVLWGLIIAGAVTVIYIVFGGRR